MDLLNEAVRRLEAEDATFVAIWQDRVIVSHDRGIAPILKLLSVQEDSLRGACVADKVIGKAAALLLCHAGIDQLFAKIVSEHAVEVLREHSLPFRFERSVPHIVNRTGDGMCPMEQLVLRISRPEDAFVFLRERIIDNRPDVGRAEKDKEKNNTILPSI